MSAALRIVLAASVELAIKTLPEPLAIRTTKKMAEFYTSVSWKNKSFTSEHLNRLQISNDIEDLQKTIFRNQVMTYGIERVATRQSHATLTTTMNNTRVEAQSAAALAAIRDETRPVLIAMGHFSTFISISLALLSFSQERRKLIILGGDTAVKRTRPVRNHWRDIGFTISDVVSLDDQATLKAAIKAVRDENAIAVTFCDLPGRYGETFPCTLLGQEARVCGGHLKLARLLGCKTIFAYCRTQPFSDTPDIVLHDLLETAPRAPGLDAWAHKAEYMTVQLLEAALRDCPELWAHWSDLPYYFDTYPVRQSRKEPA